MNEQVMDVASDSGIGNLLKQIKDQLNGRSGIDKLAEAYVSAWAELDVVVKDSTNPHFGSDYASLKATLGTIRPVFAKYKLALLQSPGQMNAAGDRISVPGILMHASGQHFSFNTELPLGNKATAQAAGSAITYARRYQAQAVGGIAPADDDGEAATRGKERTSSPGENGYEDQKADLVAKLEAADSAEAVKALRDAVVELGDEAVGKLWVKRLETFKGKKEKKA